MNNRDKLAQRIFSLRGPLREYKRESASYYWVGPYLFGYNDALYSGMECAGKLRTEQQLERILARKY